MKTDEVDIFKEGYEFNSEHDIHLLYDNALKILPYCYKKSSGVNITDGTLRCQKLDNI